MYSRLVRKRLSTISTEVDDERMPVARAAADRLTASLRRTVGVIGQGTGAVRDAYLTRLLPETTEKSWIAHNSTEPHPLTSRGATAPTITSRPVFCRKAWKTLATSSKPRCGEPGSRESTTQTLCVPTNTSVQVSRRLWVAVIIRHDRGRAGPLRLPRCLPRLLCVIALAHDRSREGRRDSRSTPSGGGPAPATRRSASTTAACGQGVARRLGRANEPL